MVLHFSHAVPKLRAATSVLLLSLLLFVALASERFHRHTFSSWGAGVCTFALLLFLGILKPLPLTLILTCLLSQRHEYYLGGRLEVKPGAKVLDCGCGIGGPYRNIAKFTGADITGITINEYQVRGRTTGNLAARNPHE